MTKRMTEATGRGIVLALGGTPPDDGKPTQAMYITEATGLAIKEAIENGGGGEGSVVTFAVPVEYTAVMQGIQIGAIRINGTLTRIYAPKVFVLTPEETTVTLAPCPATYDFGEAEELTLTVTATSQYHFMFTCPSGAATVLTLTGITGKTGDSTLEAGKTYEVDVWAGIAYFKAIEVTAV